MPVAAAVPASIGVAGGNVAGDFGALIEIAVNDDVRRRRARPVALLEAAIAAIKARDHRVMAVARRRFGLDQRLRLGAPFLAFIAVADAAEEMQRAEDFR